MSTRPAVGEVVPARPATDPATRAPDGEPSAAAWLSALSDLVAGRGVEAVYQPIVDLSRGVIAGYEALGRFRHPEIDAGPDVWFAMASAHGVAAELDAAAIRAALAARSSLPPDCFLS